MSIWFAIPSKRPPDERESCLAQWHSRGYNTAVFLDDLTHWESSANLVITGEYRGYAASVNKLVANVLSFDPLAEWIVTGGDDTLPDPHKSAFEIGRQCSDHFRILNIDRTGETFNVHQTFGVMQPTGDRWGDKLGAYIDRVAGSPWLGREWCELANGGLGPLWPEYFHMGCDEELQAVATRIGVFWQRPDLTHRHAHWGRPREGERLGRSDRMPAYLARANSAEEWHKYKRLFALRQQMGFPGSEPL